LDAVKRISYWAEFLVPVVANQSAHGLLKTLGILYMPEDYIVYICGGNSGLIYVQHNRPRSRNHLPVYFTRAVTLLSIPCQINCHTDTVPASHAHKPQRCQSQPSPLRSTLYIGNSSILTSWSQSHLTSLDDLLVTLRSSRNSRFGVQVRISKSDVNVL